jgi:DNA-binding NarL/FixJ family response regulator
MKTDAPPQGDFLENATRESASNPADVAEVSATSSRAVNFQQGIRVFIVAPPMVSWGLERLIQGAGAGMEWIGSAASLAAGLNAVSHLRCDVLVAALQLSDDFAGLFRQRKDSGVKVLVVSDDPDYAVLDRMIDAGARGIVHTSDPPAMLLKAIEKVHAGELWINRAAAGRILVEMVLRKAGHRNDPEQTKIATLTGRERQTVAAVVRDASAPGKVIAERLCISERTLRNHLTSIYSKLELSSRLDLYAYAARHRLMDDSVST